jgi:hemoglobin-like flavoprotein
MFYEQFLASSELVRAKFNGTDMAKQKRHLMASLHMMILASSGDDAAELYLSRIAKDHSKDNLDIKPEMYSLWLESLLLAVKETDPEWNEEIEAAWGAIMSYGIEFMKNHY